MLWGLFGGTELLSAQFLLSTETSRNTKARWIVPLIFALTSGRGAKHSGVWLQQRSLPNTQSGFLSLKLLFIKSYQPSLCIGVLRRALPARESSSLVNRNSYRPSRGTHRASRRKTGAAGRQAAFPSPAIGPKSSPKSAGTGCWAARQEQRAEAALRRMQGEQPLRGTAKRSLSPCGCLTFP